MLHPLHRLRRLLALVAALTAALIAAACHFQSLRRALAVLAAGACIVAWLALLEAEARAAERLETRARRRLPHRPSPRVSARPVPAGRRRRRAA
ncbi:MAG TPA: hypothetical protein VIG88_01860 [Lysobacter sp.]